MYICICKGITEEQLKTQVKTGKPTKEILKNLGVGDDCGVCVLAALDKITSHIGEQKKKADSIKV